MSHSTNSNVNFCDVCNLSIETKKALYGHQSCDSKNKELLEKMYGSDDDGAITEPPAKTMEMIYDSDEDFINSKLSTKTITDTKTKDYTKDIFKTKPSLNLKLKPKKASTLELSVNVKNVMQNLEKQ